MLYSHTVKENAAQRSDAHSQPAHRFSGWKSPCAQRGQIWYHNTAGKGGSKGQYWYGRNFCLGKSLRECKQLLVIVWGHIQSQVLLVCFTAVELECTWKFIIRVLLLLLLLFYGIYHVSNVASSYLHIACWRISDVILHIHTKSWLNKCGLSCIHTKMWIWRQFIFLDSFQCPLTSWKHALSQVDWLFLTFARRRRWRGWWQHASSRGADERAHAFPVVLLRIFKGHSPVRGCTVSLNK